MILDSDMFKLHVNEVQQQMHWCSQSDDASD